MIYGYIRVSSDKQTVENQRFEINNFCNDQKMKIDGWIEETISGTKAYSKRELGKLLNKVQKDDLIICAELSRLGRNLFMIMEILNICMGKECRVANEPKKPWHEKKQRGWYWDVLKGKRVLQRSTNFMVRKFSYKNY